MFTLTTLAFSIFGYLGYPQLSLTIAVIVTPKLVRGGIWVLLSLVLLARY